MTSNFCFYENQHASQYIQGDLYSTKNFNSDASYIDNQLFKQYPFWLLVNRTCQLVQNPQRKIKLAFLNFAGTTEASIYFKTPNFDSVKKIKATIKDMIDGRIKGFLYLPANKEKKIINPLIVNCNSLISIPTQNAPTEADKILQMSSPFAEHIFQRFSLAFFEVAIQDDEIRSENYLNTTAETIYNTQLEVR